MKIVILLLFAVATAFAAEDSCDGRCQNGFDPTKKCQCDTLCKYYQSCCLDFDITCRKKVARGDTFDFPEEDLNSTVSTNTTAVHTTITPAPEPEAETCSGKAFDAFLQLKNGSIYAFRDEYFYELDEKAMMPGYPKLIKDVWGIAGPVDAAFTRINCQGKSYIFKGNKYWRFDGDVLNEDYPREISVGFEKIPDNIDTAFAIPAPGHNKKEKVYFFKGDRYYQYEFKHQPSHEECAHMSKSSPSTLFTHYTDLYCDYNFDNLFTLLFQDLAEHHKGPRYISRDWRGIEPPIDAAMVGRLYMNAAPSASPPEESRINGRSLGKRKRKGKGKGGRVRLSSFWEDFDLDYEERYFGSKRHNKKKGRHGRRPSVYDYIFDSTDYPDLDIGQEKATPVQNVYFFQKDKYYRVNLQTKRIDSANPPYPRSIGKYWLGCKEKQLAEKR